MEATSRSEQAYLNIKKKISDMDSGCYLSIRSLASEFGMSYTPVREAFLRLEKEGILRQVPNVGFFIQEYDFSALVHYYQVRECLEPFVLRNAFDQLTQDDIQEMRMNLDESVQAIHNKNYSAFVHSDIALHEVFFQRYGNPHLSTLYHSIREQHMCCSKDVHSGVSYAIEDHQKLFESIQTGKKEEAIGILVSHIEHAKSRMLEGFTQVID